MCKGMVTGPLHPAIVHFITFMAIALINGIIPVQNSLDHFLSRKMGGWTSGMGCSRMTNARVSWCSSSLVKFCSCSLVSESIGQQDDYLVAVV
jgi:uncharacterized membrane protein